MLFRSSFGQSISVLSLTRVTARWYSQLASNNEAIAAFWFSLRLGLASAVLALALGTMAAFGIVRQRFRGKWLLQAMLFSPMVVPEIIIAVALLSFFAFLRIPRGWPALVIGHTVLLLPYVISIVSAKLHGFDRSLEEAAWTAGATRLGGVRRILMPLALPLPSLIPGGLVSNSLLRFDHEQRELDALAWIASRPAFPFPGREPRRFR